MARIGLIIAASLGLALPLCAQSGITIKSKQGKIEDHGAAAKAKHDDSAPRADTEGDPEAIKHFVDDVHKARTASFSAGDLTQDEVNKLVEKARKKLEKDMAKLQERERENAHESDPGDRAEEAADIAKDRYRASLRALERDLLYSIERLRKPGGDKYEGDLDDMEDKVKDSFADLDDQIDDGGKMAWDKTLDAARKFHAGFHKQIDQWAVKIGINPDVPNAKETIVDLKKYMLARVKRLRKLGGSKYSNRFDDIEERIHDTYEGLEEKLEDAQPKTWGDLVKQAKNSTISFAAELDGWARKIGVDESLPTPLERLAQMKRDLKNQLADLRRIGGDEYQDECDEINDAIDDVFADLKDKILDESKDAWAGTLEVAAKYQKQFNDSINMWQRKIVGAADKPEQKLPGVKAPEPQPGRTTLPTGEQADVVDGVRVARLMPLPKKQLGLSNGLSVNEIVDAEGALARAGLEVYDIILKVNDHAVDTRIQLRDRMNAVERGSEYTIEIMRDGKKQTLKATK